MPHADRGQARERRVVVSGALVVVVALALTWIVLPFAREWSRREAAISALRLEADSLAGLMVARAMLEARATEREAALAASGRRVFHARSLTLAASALQSLLTDAADASHLVVTRLDVAQDVEQDIAQDFQQDFAQDSERNGESRVAPVDGDVAAADAAGVRARTVSLPATLTAYGDVIGLAALLEQLARAPRVVRVERMTVQQNSALRGAADVLQVTISLRAPVVIE